MAVERKTLFVINDFTVKENSVYVLRDKRDMDAPSGFIKAGLSKLPSRGVGESYQVGFFSRDGGRTGVWDTGFFEYSPCYKDKDQAEVKIIVAALKKNLVTPYRKAVGNDTAFAEGEDKFYSETNFKSYSGKTYNTGDPVAAMELYFGLLTHQLTPKGSEGNTRYNDSPYVVVDISKDLKVKDERALAKFQAIGAFSTMLVADKERLYSILKYIGLSFSDTIDGAVLIGMFNDYVTNSNEDRIIVFNNLVAETEEKSGLEKVYLYKILKEQSLKGGKVTKAAGLFFYDNVEIGADLKGAADNIAKQSKLVNIKRELLTLDNED